MPSILDLVKDPDFLSLPAEEQRKAFAEVDKDFASLPKSEQDKGVMELTASDPRQKFINQESDNSESKKEEFAKGLIGTAQRPETVLPGNMLSEYDVNKGNLSDIGGSVQGAYNYANAPRIEAPLPTYKETDIVRAFEQAGKPDISLKPKTDESGAMMAVAPKDNGVRIRKDRFNPFNDSGDFVPSAEETQEIRTTLTQDIPAFVLNDIPNIIKSAPSNFQTGIAKNVAGVERFLGEDTSGGDSVYGFDKSAEREGFGLIGKPSDLQSEGAAIASGAMQTEADTSKQYPMKTEAGRLTQGAISSISQQLPGLALSVTGIPAFGLTLMGVQAFGTTYAEDRAKGRSPEDSAANAAVNLVTEPVTEILPFAKFAKGWNSGFSAKILKGYIAGEYTGEIVAQSVEGAFDVAFDEKDPNKRVEAAVDYLVSQKHMDAQKDVFWQTAIQSILMLGAGKMINKARGVQSLPEDKQAEYDQYAEAKASAIAYENIFGKQAPIQPVAPAWLENSSASVEALIRTLPRGKQEALRTKEEQIAAPENVVIPHTGIDDPDMTVDDAIAAANSSLGGKEPLSETPLPTDLGETHIETAPVGSDIDFARERLAQRTADNPFTGLIGTANVDASPPGGPSPSVESGIATPAASSDQQGDLTPEQRQFITLRKNIDEMTPEEQKIAIEEARNHIMTNAVTGIPSKTAYLSEDRLGHHAAIDADSLKWVNDNLGHEAGDEMLKSIGQAIAEETDRGYHISGDEFIIEGKDESEVHAIMERVNNRLKNAEIVATAPDGTVYRWKGLEATYGTGQTLKEADDHLNVRKAEREATGERAARGEKPAGILAESPQGNNAESGAALEVILAKGNIPFKTERGAGVVLKAKGLAGTHEVVSKDGGFVIQPKGDSSVLGRATDQPVGRLSGSEQTADSRENNSDIYSESGDIRTYGETGGESGNQGYDGKLQRRATAEDVGYDGGVKPEVQQGGQDGSPLQHQLRVIPQNLTSRQSAVVQGIDENIQSLFPDAPRLQPVESLTAGEAEISKHVEAQTGRPAVFLEAHPMFYGTYHQGEIILVRGGGVPYKAVAEHEITHSKEGTPEYDAMFAELSPLMDEGAVIEKQKELSIAFKRQVTYEYAQQEIIADLAGNRASDSDAYPTPGRVFTDLDAANKVMDGFLEGKKSSAVRESGYDSVVSVGKQDGKVVFTEVFDVREDAYPSEDGDYSIHPKFGWKESSPEVNGIITPGPAKFSLATHGDFETGKPVTFNFVHNTESATKLFGKPTKESPHDRGYEPSGRYVTVVDKPMSELPKSLITGTLTFENPLVVDADRWKRNLSESFGNKTGKRLSQAIIDAGHDGVVTVAEHSGGKYISETLDLTTFDKSKAKYSLAPPFSSKLEEVVNSKMSNKMFVPQLRAMLANNGVTQDEISTVLVDLDPSKSVTKAEVKDIILANSVDLTGRETHEDGAMTAPFVPITENTPQTYPKFSLTDKQKEEEKQYNGYISSAEAALDSGDTAKAMEWLDKADALAEKVKADRFKAEANKTDSALSKRVEAATIAEKLVDSFGELTGYSTMNMKEQADLATAIMNSDYESAKKMAMGELYPPEGVREATMFEAVKIRALGEGDVETLRRLATESTIPSRLSEYGQMIKAADSRLMDDPVKVMQEIMEYRQERSKKMAAQKETDAEVARLKAELETARAALDAKYAEHALKKLKKEADKTNRPANRSVKMEVLKTERADILKKLNAKFGRISANPMLDPETISLMMSLARNSIEMGINTANGVIDSIYTDVKKAFKGIKKRDIRDALSNYGKTRELSKEELEVTLRELKRQWLMISKIEDAKSGKLPETTGMKRDPKSDDIRLMEQELNQIMKQLGLDNLHSTEDHMKTALDAVKTRLKNDITDLDRQIAAQKRDPVKKTGVKYDQEAMALKTIRDEKKAILDSIDEKPGISAQRRIEIALQSIERSIENYNRKISTKDFSAKEKAERPESEALRVKWLVRDALKKTFDQMKKDSKPVKDPDAIRLQSAKTRMQNEINKIEGLLSEGGFSKADKKPPVDLDSEGKRLRKEYEQAKENYRAAIDASGLITKEEAAKIVRLSKLASDLREAIAEGGSRFEYGAARVEYENYVNRLKGSELSLKTRLRERIQEAKATWADNKPKAAFELGKDFISTVSNNSIAMVASFDNSFLGRQGLKMLFTHPTAWAPGARKSFSDFAQTLGGKNAHDAMLADIYSRENYLNGEYQRAKIIAKTEEQYPTSIPERIPGVGRVFKASEVAFKGSALRMRTDLYDMLSARAKDLGVDLGNKTEIESLGKMINALTARGIWGKTGEPPIVRLFLWAPKMLKANIDVLTAHGFGSGLDSKFTQKEAAKNLLKIVSITALLMAIANALLPDSAELDPRSSDFGKIKVGTTRFDITGGAASLVVLASRIISYALGMPSIKSPETGLVRPFGNNIGQKTAFDAIIDFLKNKTTPPMGVLISWLDNKNKGSGEDFTWSNAAFTSFTPISLQNMIKMGDDVSADKIVGAMVDLIGINANSYSDDGSKKRDIVNRMRRGKELNEDQQKAFDKLSKQSQKNAKHDAKHTAPEISLQHMPLKELADMVERSNQEERSEFMPYFRRKYYTAKGLNSEDREKYKAILNNSKSN